MGTDPDFLAAVAVTEFAPPPSPPYPRPEYHTLVELAAVLAEVYSLGCLLITVGGGPHA
jgi:hypothetical protein